MLNADDDDSEEENGNLSCGISSTLNCAEAEAIEVLMREVSQRLSGCVARSYH